MKGFEQAVYNDIDENRPAPNNDTNNYDEIFILWTKNNLTNYQSLTADA